MFGVLEAPAVEAVPGGGTGARELRALLVPPPPPDVGTGVECATLGVMFRKDLNATCV